MYHKFHATAEAVEEMGIRAVISSACFDHFQPELAEKSKQTIQKLYKEMDRYDKRIHFSVGPHAIYTVSGELLQWADTFAKEHNVPIQLHLAETRLLDDEHPSVPRPTVMPASRISLNLKCMPDASFILEAGL